MAASKYDFAIEQGTSFKISLVYKDASGVPVDITDWCARLTWKTNLNATQVFHSDNTDHSVYNTAKYDLELQSPDELYANGGGKYVTRILFGTVSIIKRFSQTTEALDCSI